MTPNWFVAFPIDLALDLGALPPRVRALSSADLHLTLAFLGGCSESAASAAWSVAERLPLAPAAVSLGRVELLGGRTPSAVSALLTEGRQAVEEAIRSHREALLRAAGAPLDDRPPKAHVTIARIQRKASPIQRVHAAEWATRLELDGKCQLDRIALYTWSEARSPASQFRIVKTRLLEGEVPPRS